MDRPFRRLAISALAIASWLGLLLHGVAAFGTVHLLLLLGLVSYPWRRRRSAEDPPEGPPPRP